MSDQNGLVGLSGESNKIPVGGELTLGGMIGKFSAQVLFAFYSTTDIALAEVQPPKGLVVRKFGKGFRYYLKDQAALDTVREALGEQYKPQQSWVFTAARDSIVNMPKENLDKFNESISMELNITTLGSKKNRHALHMIALPALVHSVAKQLGYDVPDISFSALIGNQVVFDDALQTKMIGDDKGYVESQLWQQRQALWQALGESDASKYQPIKTGTKFDTTSEKLSNCLNYLTHDWSGMWCRVAQVPDPRVDAVYGDESKRLSIPAVMDIFASEKLARETGAKELAERAERVAAKSGSNGSEADPTVPKAWQSDPGAWKAWIAELKAHYQGKQPPVVNAGIKKLVADAEAKNESCGATVEQILAAMKA